MTCPEVSQEQMAQWHDDGYLIVPRVLDGEEIDLLNQIARADKGMDQAVDSLDAEGGVSRLRLCNELDDDMYSAISRSRRIVDTVQILLGGEVYHWHHKMMLKEARIGGAWEWHQDYGYWYVNNHCLFPDMASCAIAVDRASKSNGCLQVIKGSHKCGRIEHGRRGDQAGADLERVNALLERLPRVYAELNPGDALFFHCNLLHCSDQNRSDKPRWTLICCYNTRRNNPYKDNQGGHRAYFPLDVIDDGQIKIIGRKQWAKLCAAKTNG